MTDPGSQERSSYLKVAVVFVVSCGLAAGGIAIHDAGGFSALFGPQLEDFDATPPPGQAPGGPAGKAAAPVRRSPGKRPPRPRRPAVGPSAGRGSAPAATPDAVAPGDAANVSPPVPAPAAALGNGRLIVRCSQPCRVTVDGSIVGEANPVLKLVQPAGDHQVRVEELDGDDLATKRVLVAPNRDREITFMLGQKPVVKDFFDGLKGTEGWE